MSDYQSSPSGRSFEMEEDKEDISVLEGKHWMIIFGENLHD